MKPLIEIMKLNLERYGSKLDIEKFKATFLEEVQEVIDALEAGDMDAFIDGCNDCIVVAAGGITQAGYNPELTLKQVVKEITSREQDPIQAYAWKLNPELQDTEKWMKNKNQTDTYKADFKTCKLGYDI
jgi:NTP pyrophosphatase (non-canonical NTP hydrolase)